MNRVKPILTWRIWPELISYFSSNNQWCFSKHFCRIWHRMRNKFNKHNKCSSLSSNSHPDKFPWWSHSQWPVRTRTCPKLSQSDKSKPNSIRCKEHLTSKWTSTNHTHHKPPKYYRQLSRKSTITSHIVSHINKMTFPRTDFKDWLIYKECRLQCLSSQSRSYKATRTSLRIWYNSQTFSLHTLI